ncbi:MAG: YidC/Oxa1 family membrane protein insertase [Patescibacteria group bacterium]
MGGIFFTLLTQPMYNALIWLYSVLPGNDLGVAIILLTVIIKLILWPFTGQSLKSQTAMQQLQPKIEEVKEKYKNDKEGQAKAMMALYKEEKVNPFSSCLPLLVQLPILLALYNVLRRSVTDPEMLQALYGFVPAPEAIHTVFIGLVDLATRSIPLAVLAGVVQYAQVKMIQVKTPAKGLAKKEGARDEAMMASMTKSMTYMMPILTVVFGMTLPSGVMLYWLVSGLVSVLQQWLVMRRRAATV